MKKILLALFLTPLFAVSAENAFVDGTVWEMYVSTLAHPSIKPRISTNKIDGVREIGGYEALLMYRESSFEAFVRTEGDKVYCAWDEENPEWYLCFDFGMKPGDEQVFYNMDVGKPSEGRLMRCVAEMTNTAYGDWPALEMVQVINGKEYEITEIWLKGLGSQFGPTVGPSAGLIGGGSSDIRRVTNGDRVIFEKPESGIAAPTVEQPSGAVSYYNLQGMRVSNPSGGVFIRVEGGKTSKVLLK